MFLLTGIYKMFGFLNMITMVMAARNVENLLYNDICATVSKSSENSSIAKVECHYDSVIFDLKSQNGTLYIDDTGSWNGEIFACQCSCRVPNPPINGNILTDGRVQHGKNLEYKCNDGKENNKIICFDGLLMIIPEFIEAYDIKIAFRQKSLPEHFLNEFKDAIFQLSVNKMSDWSVQDSEVINNLKYTEIHSEKDASLTYYLFNGVGFKLGTIDLKVHLKLECGKPFDWSFAIGLCSSIVFVGILSTILLSVQSCFPEQFESFMGSAPLPRIDLDDMSYLLTEDEDTENEIDTEMDTENEIDTENEMDTENEIGVVEVTENANIDPVFPDVPLVPAPQPPEDVTSGVVQIG
ncbi:hypothetical protein ACJMK2_014358 [Sinanodonta woodiana]|uniref:Uncharacterized protein n=1 Tax=Sinanodonta woodiana TaxID=1069815 RepID=A0ABD3V1N8_SINWO